MPDVEAKLNITAEYQQAYTAIQMLGKALDAVQQRAKIALAVSGGAQGGSQGGGGTGEAETQQKAAVEALGAAMKDAAAAAATLAESVAKLTPALEAMGPQAAQVQKVQELAGHYKELATAMGIAADAAAKYKESGGDPAASEERVKQLIEENERIMEQVELMREAYAELVNETREREKNNNRKRESINLEKNWAWQMYFAKMSAQELIVEIKKLTKERKEAAAAYKTEDYNDKTLQLGVARQALAKLRQEVQLSKIEFLQKAQVAQQLGRNMRTVVDGFVNFSEAAENGKLNLTEMASAAVSFGLAIKSGLGPLGWVLAAVEGLTTAWNWYANSQKEAEEAEKKRQKAAASLVTEYINAANEAERLRNAEADRSKIDTLTSGYRDLNTELRNRNKLLTTSLRMISAEAAMTAKKEDFENTVAKNDILVSFYTGKITEEQRDKLLDELDVKKAAQKGERAVAQAKREAETKSELEANMFQYMRTTGERKSALDLEGQRFMYSEADMQKLLTTYSQTESEYKKAKQREEEIKKEIDKLEKKYLRFDETRKVFRFDTSSLGLMGPSIARNYASLRKEIETLNVDYKKDAFLRAQENLLGWSPEDIESGQYARRKKTHDESVQVAQNALIEARKEWQRAKAEKDASEEKLRLAETSAKQDVELAERTTQERARLQTAKKEFEEAKRVKEQIEKEKKRAEEKAKREREQEEKRLAKEAEKRAKLNKAVRVEAKSEKTTLSKTAESLLKRGNVIVGDGISESEAKAFGTLMQEAAKKNNAALMTLVDYYIKVANDLGNTSENVLAHLRRDRQKYNNQFRNNAD